MKDPQKDLVRLKRKKYSSKELFVPTIHSNARSIDINLCPGGGGGGGGGGLPYEMDGDARRLASGCKFRILVSLRAFWAKCHYF